MSYVDPSAASTDSPLMMLRNLLSAIEGSLLRPGIGGQSLPSTLRIRYARGRTTTKSFLVTRSTCRSRRNEGGSGGEDRPPVDVRRNDAGVPDRLGLARERVAVQHGEVGEHAGREHAGVVEVVHERRAAGVGRECLLGAQRLLREQ